MTCLTCAHFREEGRNAPDDLYKDGRCCDEDESNPMHWQSTYSDFGCIRHFAVELEQTLRAALPIYETYERAEKIAEFCKARKR